MRSASTCPSSSYEAGDREAGTVAFSVPSVSSVVNGELRARQLRNNKVRLGRVKRTCSARSGHESRSAMAKFLLWCILFILCWPLALVALVLYPIVWLLLLPFRVVGIAVGGVLELVGAIILLPARLIRAI